MNSLSAYLLAFGGLQDPAPPPVEQPRPEVGQLTFFTGAFAVNDDHVFEEGGIEWRLPARGPWELGPMVGITWIEGDAWYSYAGLRREFDLTRGFYVAPSVALGIYEEREDLNLGGPIEFRTAVELGYRFSDRLTLSLTYYHLSNSSLYELNGGSESLIFGASAKLF